MKIHIDLSLFYGATGAFGNIHGNLELAAAPFIGSSIVLVPALNETLPVLVPGFNGVVKVTDVRFAPASSLVSEVSLSLEDLVLQSEDDARKVMKYLEEGFGLYGDEYDQKLS
jgi:hypothetical protein